MKKKDITYIFIILVLIALGLLLFLQYSNQVTVIENDDMELSDPMPVEPDGGIGDGAEPLDELLEAEPVVTIGESINGNQIQAHRFGNGETDVLLVGGVHGGYAWNTSALAYQLIDYYEEQPARVPESVTLHIIPALNPDGLTETLGGYDETVVLSAGTVSEASRVAGRFNTADVDLNRNFACNWQPESTWQNRTVSGGSAAFSEPEAVALRDYVNQIDPEAAIVWFAAEGTVYPSACNGEPSAASTALAATFAGPADYDTDPVFDAYAITGDMVNWMARESIPAISVLLSGFESTEFDRNLAGIEAVLDTYAE
jgi:hypothetical protein